jgi:hypothetical protein
VECSGRVFLIFRLIDTKSVGFETKAPISSKGRILPFSPRWSFQLKRNSVSNREIEWPFELCKVLVVVNERIYQTPDETLLVHAIEFESRFERGQGCVVKFHTKARLRVLPRGCAAYTPARIQAVIKKQRVSNTHICA